ncbi:MAG: PAS-domain containing protein, partial [Nitrospinaceae bacterium]|nr:PAS-domain containing protein [Nitrospinaceae bacterium]
MSLKTKIILVITLMGLALGASFFFYWMPRSEEDSQRRLEGHTLSKLVIVSEVLVPLLIQNQFAVIHESLDALLEANSDWVDIALFDGDGLRIYPLKAAASTGKGQKKLTHDISLRGEPLGKLVLTVDFSGSKNAIREQSIELFKLFATGLILGLAVIIYLLEKFVGIPVENLAKVAARLKEGDYTASLPKASNDEIGNLTLSFESMRNAIRENEEALRKAHDTLEQRVEERTAELNKVDSEREQLVHAVEQLDECVVLFDGDDRIVFCNEAFRKLNKDIIEDTEPGTLFEDHLRAGVRAGIMPEGINREDEWVAERMAQHRNPTGSIEVVRQNDTTILINEQKLSDGATILVVSDITEIKHSQAQVIQASKLATLGEMATSVAHELNQPLNVIRMAAGNIQRKLAKSNFDPEYLGQKLE